MNALLIALLILLGSHTAQDSTHCTVETFEDGSAITTCALHTAQCIAITDAETQVVIDLHCAQ
jgi:hypothetical protein